jgi:hypothetical protein
LRHTVAKRSKQPSSRLAWHPAFVQAFQLELEQYREILEFIPELQLTSEPLRIDLAVIRKLKNVPIEKNIAAIFRSDNLVEYKSPGDYVSIKDFYKVYGYACLYASLNDVPITGITISFVGSRKPQRLLEHLEGVRGYRVKEEGGIYLVNGDIIPIQIIDSRELSAGENLWLKGLSKDLEIGAVVAILEGWREKGKTASIDAYLDVILNANAGVFLEVGRMRNGSITFDDVLVELGLTAKWKAEGREEGIEKGLEKAARNALAKGLPLDTIGEITGLDIETIKSFAGQ